MGGFSKRPKGKGVAKPKPKEKKTVEEEIVDDEFYDEDDEDFDLEDAVPVKTSKKGGKRVNAASSGAKNSGNKKKKPNIQL